VIDLVREDAGRFGGDWMIHLLVVLGDTIDEDNT
jgi:hypothetical protein